MTLELFRNEDFEKAFSEMAVRIGTFVLVDATLVHRYQSWEHLALAQVSRVFLGQILDIGEWTLGWGFSAKTVTFAHILLSLHLLAKNCIPAT